MSTDYFTPSCNKGAGKMIAIINEHSKCIPTAVFPFVEVKTTTGINKLHNQFVRVTDTGETYYINDVGESLIVSTAVTKDTVREWVKEILAEENN